jgi:hypothetical protein
MFVFRCIVDKCLDKKLNKNFNFLFRCYIGFTFDGIEYGILTATADNINYQRFEAIFIVMGFFIGIITVLCCCCNTNIYIVLTGFIFKTISLIIALFIFTTSMSFSWDNVERMFLEIDSAGDFFLAMITFISFLDICLVIATLIFKVIVLFCCAGANQGKCWEYMLKDDDAMCTASVFSNRVDSSG